MSKIFVNLLCRMFTAHLPTKVEKNSAIMTAQSAHAIRLPHYQSLHNCPLTQFKCKFTEKYII